MIKKTTIMKLLLVLFILSRPLSIYAEEEIHEVQIMQAYVHDQQMQIFLYSNTDTADIVCHISKDEVVASVVDDIIVTATTVLVDTSSSIPKETRDEVVLLLEEIIAGVDEKNLCRIILFGETIPIQEEFTADRYDLLKSIEKIEFSQQESKIFDALYTTMPVLQPLNDTTCFYKTLVITDGIDDTASGITKEELYVKLQQEPYPIDIVEVSGKAQVDTTKELAALMRISGGKRFNLYNGIDALGISTLITKAELKHLTANVPTNLLDGSIRQITLSNANTEHSFNLKFPVVHANEENLIASKEPDIEEPILTPTPTLTPTPEPTPTIPAESEELLADITEESNKFNVKYVLLAILIISLILITAIVIFIIYKQKKKLIKKEHEQFDNSTVFSNNDRFTALLPETYSILIYDVEFPENKWHIKINKEIFIGRSEDCDIYLKDSSVSRKQCRIFTSGGILIENLSNSNGTLLNEKIIKEASCLEKNDKIKCGNVILCVEEL